MVIIELKSVQVVIPVHKKQLLTYLKLSGKKVGLLINFNEELIKRGITRVANDIKYVHYYFLCALCASARDSLRFLNIV